MSSQTIAPPGPQVRVPRRSRPRLTPRTLREWTWFVVLAGPNVALLAVFIYRPLALNVANSTLNWNLGSDTAVQVGAQNYVDWFTDPASWRIVLTTVVFTLATVAGSMVLGLWLATVLNRRLVGRGLARTATLAPYVMPGVAIGIMWLFVFDPNYGLVNGLLRAVGLSGPNWYNDPGWALTMLVVVYLWQNTGYTALIYLAGLQAVPRELLDAAAIDGAGSGATFRRIVLPLLSPTTLFLAVTSTINSFQCFDLIKVMTDGGPLESTVTLVYSVYQEAFVNGRAGYGSAVATILFALMLVLALAQMKLLERKVHYQ